MDVCIDMQIDIAVTAVELGDELLCLDTVAP